MLGFKPRISGARSDHFGNCATATASSVVMFVLHVSAVLSEMPANDWKPDPAEVQRRKDFRESHLIMSIDPKGCEDVDDALSVRKLKNGRIELGGDQLYNSL